MKIGFVVNDVRTEEPGYTTTRLAMAAINRGHEAWVIGAAPTTPTSRSEREPDLHRRHSTSRPTPISRT
jgi:hypothetical protein